MAGGGGEGELTVESTPTWIVALVCFVIVAISLVAERSLHFIGKKLMRNNQKPLYEALLKLKEELMLVGFISLMLVVFQGKLLKICVPPSTMTHMLPCKNDHRSVSEAAHFGSAFSSGVLGGGRRLLAPAGGSDYCAKKGKIPLLSSGAIHDLHIFIFVLALTHVVFTVTTMILGSLRIRQWKRWEDAIQSDASQAAPNNVTHVDQIKFIQDRFKGMGKDSWIVGWVSSFFKQFYGSVTKSDYQAMRLGFIMTHCRGNPKFNFYKYMLRVLEADFKKVVGISWYLWIIVVIFLLLNVDGWKIYFWMSFVPLLLLLAVGAKLEHVITQLAHDVAEKHVAIEGELIIHPSNEHFWFNEPKILLYLIHYILFQNAFEIAYFFWIWTNFGFHSCIMGKVRFVIPRLAIGVIVQLLCSYSTLPIYAIVTQMGSSFKRAMFDEHLQEGLLGWAKKAKKRKGTNSSTTNQTIVGDRSPDVLLHNAGGH